jgi:hypothetical protein
MVGVGEAVDVVVGIGEGVTVSIEPEVIGKLVKVREGGEGWHAAIIIKTSAAVPWMNRQTHCFIK